MTGRPTPLPPSVLYQRTDGAVLCASHVRTIASECGESEAALALALSYGACGFGRKGLAWLRVPRENPDGLRCELCVAVERMAGEPRGRP